MAAVCSLVASGDKKMLRTQAAMCKPACRSHQVTRTGFLLQKVGPLRRVAAGSELSTLVTLVTDAHGALPATRRHGAPRHRAIVADAQAAAATMVDRLAWTERQFADGAGAQFVIGGPVRRACRVLDQP